MEWESILSDSVNDGSIKELHLSKIPLLKTCNNWRDVEPIGSIDHEMKFVHYKGGLVRLNGKIYFVPDKTISVIRRFIKFKFPQSIKVIKD